MTCDCVEFLNIDFSLISKFIFRYIILLSVILAYIDLFQNVYYSVPHFSLQCNKHLLSRRSTLRISILSLGADRHDLSLSLSISFALPLFLFLSFFFSTHIENNRIFFGNKPLDWWHYIATFNWLLYIISKL